MDLTPGVSIASSVIGELDTDLDGAVAPAEAEAYGRAVVSDLRVTLDDNPLIMTLVRIETPTMDEMRDGMGTIRVRAAAGIEAGVGAAPSCRLQQSPARDERLHGERAGSRGQGSGHRFSVARPPAAGISGGSRDPAMADAVAVARHRGAGLGLRWWIRAARSNEKRRTKNEKQKKGGSRRSRPALLSLFYFLLFTLVTPPAAIS